MILTVTLNPLLERRLRYDKIVSGHVNRTNKEKFAGGGKGINVSRQLNHLSVKNFAFTFLGGNNGKILRHLLAEGQIEFNAVAIKSETRTATLAIDNETGQITSFFGPDSEITKEEADEFKSKLEKVIINCSAVVFAGSSPSEVTDDIFSYGIELAHKHDKISMLDTYGRHLKRCIEAAPTAMHNNIQELERSLGINLQNEKDKLDFMKELYGKNVKMIFLTDGDKPAYASKFGFNFRIEFTPVDAVDATGSGDAFVAGIMHGLDNSLVFDEFLRNAAALGTANASKLETCTVTPEEMNNYLGSVKISPIGKKMKIIDDSPNY